VVRIIHGIILVKDQAHKETKKQLEATERVIEAMKKEISLWQDVAHRWRRKYKEQKRKRLELQADKHDNDRQNDKKTKNEKLPKRDKSKE
jgi:hypothetical protein